LAPVASLWSIYHLRPRTGLVGPVTWWGIMFVCGMVLWYADTLKPGLSLLQHIWPLTHSYKLLINDVKPLHHIDTASKMKDTKQSGVWFTEFRGTYWCLYHKYNNNAMSYLQNTWHFYLCTRVVQKVLQMLGFHRYKHLILAKFVMIE